MTALLERWSVRTSDACVAFRGRASRFTPTVHARFTGVTGTVSETEVDVEVDVRTLTTGSAAYDEVLARVDPFDASRHPFARYRSASVHRDGDTAVVDGDLTLRGRSVPVRLTASYVPLGDGLARMTATGRVDRRQLGLRLELPGCGALVPTSLDLSIAVTAVRG